MNPREVIKRVRRLEIRTRRLVDQSLAGSYHSVFRGRGMEFSEVRDYVPGDDVRTIDWNVSARMGDPYVKKFTEERELTVMLLVDVSGSERFGTGPSTKLEMVAEISALLSFSAIRNNDRVGLILFTDEVELYLPPRKGKEHGLRVLREVLTAEPKRRGTDINRALTYFQKVTSKRAVVFLLSDFQDRGFDRTLRVAAQKHDIVAFSIGDPREQSLPPVGLVSLIDPESGEPVLVDAGSRRVRQRYAEVAERERTALRDLLRRSGVDMLELSTDRDFESSLVKFFHERARRIGAG